MLTRLIFKNFKSFKDTAILDLSANKITEFSEHLLQHGNEKALPVISIWPNPNNLLFPSTKGTYLDPKSYELQLKAVSDKCEIQKVNKLEAGMAALFEIEKYAAYLQTMSRFHRYSTRNTILIHLQRPSATRVGGYRFWQNEFNRQVKKGERSIKIFAPMPFSESKEFEKLDP